MRSILLASLIFSAAAAQAASIDSAQQALAAVEQAGYQSPHDLEYKYGYWTVEATTPNGVHADVLIDPQSGELFVFESMSAALPPAQVVEKLSAAGYERIRDMEFDDGFWEAEARNPQGIKVELVLHPLTGEVLLEEIDQHD